MYLPTKAEQMKTIHISLWILEVSTSPITQISTQYNGLETPANPTLSLTAFIWKYLPFINFDSGSVSIANIPFCVFYMLRKQNRSLSVGPDLVPGEQTIDGGSVLALTAAVTLLSGTKVVSTLGVF